jgi:ubiquinone biosynthesis protein UbiJ
MLDAAPTFLRAAVIPRAILLANHVIASEPAATRRLVPMSGRRIDLKLADVPPPIAWAGAGLLDVSVTITPAGLLEWAEHPTGTTDLLITVDASNPLAAALRAAAGERPDVRIEGDAAFAAEVSWLLEHLRWDFEEDLARVVGPAVAHQMARIGGAVRPAVQRFAATAAGLAAGLSRQGPISPSPGPGDPPGPAPR